MGEEIRGGSGHDGIVGKRGFIMNLDVLFQRFRPMLEFIIGSVDVVYSGRFAFSCIRLR